MIFRILSPQPDARTEWIGNRTENVNRLTVFICIGDSLRRERTDRDDHVELAAGHFFRNGAIGRYVIFSVEACDHGVPAITISGSCQSIEDAFDGVIEQRRRRMLQHCNVRYRSRAGPPLIPIRQQQNTGRAHDEYESQSKPLQRKSKVHPFFPALSFTDVIAACQSVSLYSPLHDVGHHPNTSDCHPNVAAGFSRRQNQIGGAKMAIRDLLLTEFDEEMKKTRTMLERVPADKKDFTPHAKSMPLGRLAPHVAELAGFGLTVLTTPGLDFSQGSFKPLALESAEQLVRVLDEGSAK